MGIKDVNNPVSNNISQIIRSKGLKQCVIAEKIGLTPNMFSALLNDRKIITAAYIKKIANALEVPIGELFKEGED